MLKNNSLLAATDLRGHVKIIGLQKATTESLVEAISKLAGNYFLVPHLDTHRLLKGNRFIGNHEIFEGAHPPLEFMPNASQPSKTGGQQDHIWELEQESISIIRQAVAAAKKPAMLFSMGKDSMAMLRLAEKAFAPEQIPFPLVIIDTRWKFQEMYSFRRWLECRSDLNLIIHINPDAIEQDVNPFDFGSAMHTYITKTQALKQILDEHKFDFVFGGARRDEEKSRAKERIFSIRDIRHGWDPKNQRPELWDFYNTFLAEGQSMRVFPLSNWTEVDIWRYLEAEQVPVVPLYFAKRRPFVERNGSLIMVDDERFRLGADEKIFLIRFASAPWVATRSLEVFAQMLTRLRGSFRSLLAQESASVAQE